MTDPPAVQFPGIGELRKVVHASEAVTVSRRQVATTHGALRPKACFGVGQPPLSAAEIDPDSTGAGNAFRRRQRAAEQMCKDALLSLGPLGREVTVSGRCFARQRPLGADKHLGRAVPCTPRLAIGKHPNRFDAVSV
jgi:hypothetical protein